MSFSRIIIAASISPSSALWEFMFLFLILVLIIFLCFLCTISYLLSLSLNLWSPSSVSTTSISHTYLSSICLYHHSSSYYLTSLSTRDFPFSLSFDQCLQPMLLIPFLCANFLFFLFFFFAVFLSIII